MRNVYLSLSLFFCYDDDTGAANDDDDAAAALFSPRIRNDKN